MLLNFKFTRNIHNAIGQAVGWLYKLFSPTYRELMNVSAEEVAQKNEGFKDKNPRIYSLVEEACKGIGEEVPVIAEERGFYMGMLHDEQNKKYYPVVDVPVKGCENLTDNQIKGIVSHEMSHLDTDLLSVTAMKYLHIGMAASAIGVFLNQSSLFMPIAFFSIVAATALTACYRKSEELRCDENSLKLGVSEDLIKALEMNMASKILEQILTAIDFIRPYPTDWVRQEALREAERELNKDKGASLA